MYCLLYLPLSVFFVFSCGFKLLSHVLSFQHKKPLSISFRENLLVINSLFLMTSPLFLEDNSAAYSIFSWQSFQHFEYVISLTSSLHHFDEMSAINLIKDPLYAISPFSLTAFKILSFNSLLILCQVWLSLIFILLGVHWAA